MIHNVSFLKVSNGARLVVSLLESLHLLIWVSLKVHLEESLCSKDLIFWADLRRVSILGYFLFLNNSKHQHQGIDVILWGNFLWARRMILKMNDETHTAGRPNQC
ncbi:hypothetical protein MKW98_009206 [Papaver atlanticum]|uniref:Uncharacterized protein n=1 Tax=Papaver atlanticum TaxID=357466 RepID=A0AAD4XRX7_9MAGN|nr:hypothetical protein MKW98_009206 [Papaver atlanticum]